MTDCWAPVDVVPPTIGMNAVDDVRPLPPLATLSVPASVTAPDVPVLGVRPVVPAEKLVTAPEARTLLILA